MVLAADATLVIPDIREHPDFQGQRLHLRALNVVFFASAPVRTSDGSMVGILTVFRQQSREPLKDNELRTLQNLATMVSSQLELHKLRADSKRQRTRLSRSAHGRFRRRHPGRAIPTCAGPSTVENSFSTTSPWSS